MTKANLEVPDDLLMQIRKLLPNRRMSYATARIRAQQMALRIRSILGARDARLPLDFIEGIPGVTVTLLTAPGMEALTKRVSTSGATAIRDDGAYHVYINEN